MKLDEIMKSFENEASRELEIIRSQIDAAYARYAALKAVEEELILKDTVHCNNQADKLDKEFPQWRQVIIDNLRRSKK